MRKILLAIVAMSTPALAMSANKELNRDAIHPMTDSDVRDTMISRTTTARRTQNDPHTTIGRLGAAVARAVAYARNVATAFTSLHRQSTPALAIAAA